MSKEETAFYRWFNSTNPTDNHNGIDILSLLKDYINGIVKKAFIAGYTARVAEEMSLDNQASAKRHTYEKPYPYNSKRSNEDEQI